MHGPPCGKLLSPISLQSGNLLGNQVASFQPRPAASATGRRPVLFISHCPGPHTHSAIGPIHSTLFCVDRVVAKIALEPDPAERFFPSADSPACFASRLIES